MKPGLDIRTKKIPGIVCFLMLFCVLLYYLGGFFYPDGNIIRHRNDERHFHIPTIQKVLDSGILETLKTQPVTTFPLYHLVVSPFYRWCSGDVRVLRCLNLLITLLTAFLIFYYFYRSNLLLEREYRLTIALSISLAFTLSPYVRASALSVTTDNLPFFFLFSGLITADHCRKNPNPVLFPLVLLIGFFAFYTRQLYFWVPLFFLVEFLGSEKVDIRQKRFLMLMFLLFSMPSLFVFSLWHGLVPPSFQLHHHVTSIWKVIPFTFSFVPLYFVPIYLMFFKKAGKTLKLKRILLLLLLISLFCLVYMGFSFNLDVVDGGGITRLLISTFFHRLAPPLFLIIGFAGLGTILYLIVKAPKENYVWVLALAGFFTTRVFWQKYFDPLILILIFLTMSYTQKRKMASSGMIFLFPLMEAFIFLGVSILFSRNIGLP